MTAERKPAPAPAPRRAGGGVVATWIRIGIVTAVGILQAPILFRSVPAAELGVWYLFFALALFITLSDLGLPSALTRAVAFMRGHASAGATGAAPEAIPQIYRELSLSRLYASGMAATLGLSVAFAAVAFPAALLYFQVALGPGARGLALTTPLLIFLAGVVVNMVAGVSSACLNGAGELGWDNAIRTTASLLGFALIWSVIPRNPSLQALCTIYLAQGAFFLVASHLAVAWRLEAGITAVRGSAAAMRFMYREALPVFATRIGTWLVQEMNLLIAGYFLGPDRVPDFALMRQIVAIGTALITAIPVAVSPHLSAAHAAGDAPKVLSLYLASLRFSLVLAVLWAVGALVWAPDVLAVMVGPTHFLGYSVLVPLVVGSFLEQHATVHGQFIWSVGRWPFAKLSIVGGALNAALASAGCALASFMGLAWGSLLSQLTTVYWALTREALRSAGLSVRGYARVSLPGPAAFAVALGATAAALRAGLGSAFAGMLTREPGVGRAALVVAGVVATSLLAAALAWPLALTAGDRGYLARFVRLRRR